MLQTSHITNELLQGELGCEIHHASYCTVTAHACSHSVKPVRKFLPLSFRDNKLKAHNHGQTSQYLCAGVPCKHRNESVSTEKNPTALVIMSNVIESLCFLCRRDIKAFGDKVCCIQPGLFKTPLSNPAKIMKEKELIWNKLPLDIKKQYGEGYFQNGKAVSRYLCKNE